MSEIVTLGFRIDSSGVVQGVSVGEREFNRLANAADRTTKRVDAVERGFGALKRTIFSFVSFGAALKVFHDLVAETTQAETANKRLEGVLRATGRAAGLTANEIRELADQMQETSLVDDEEVKNAAAVLLTFRRVQGDAFREAIGLANDLAFVLQTDLRGAALQLGKALQDPVDGMSQLGRAGVKFTAEQEQTIKQLAKTNDLAGQQKIILDQLRRTVGGSAPGAKDGLTGALHDATTAWKELLETGGQSPLGRLLQGSLREVTGILKALTPETDTRKIAANRMAGLDAQLSTLESALDARRLGTDIGAFSHGSVPEIERKIAALRREREEILGTVLAMDARQKAEEAIARMVAKYNADQAAKEDRDAAASEAARKLAEKVKTAADALRDQAATMGMSSGQARVYELRMLGASGATLQLAEAQVDLIDTFEQFDLSALPDFSKQINEYLAGIGRAGGLPGDERLTQNQRTLQDLRNLAAYGTTDPDRIRDIIAGGGIGPSLMDPDWVYEPLSEANQEAAAEFEAIWERAAENAQDALADFFINIGAESQKWPRDMLRQFTQVIQQILAQIAAAELLSSRSDGGGWFGKLIKGLVGGGLSGSGIPSAPPIDTTVPEIPFVPVPNIAGTNFRQDVHFNVQAWDGRDVERVLVAHAPLIVGMVGQAAADSRGYRQGIARR